MSRIITSSAFFSCDIKAILWAKTLESIRTCLLLRPNDTLSLFHSGVPFEYVKKHSTVKRYAYFFPKILYIPVLHTGHFPLAAGRPFFMVTFCSSFISWLFLHLTQYPFSAMLPPFFSESSFIVSQLPRGVNRPSPTVSIVYSRAIKRSIYLSISRPYGRPSPHRSRLRSLQAGLPRSPCLKSSFAHRPQRRSVFYPSGTSARAH